jgi:hypothetical protein
MTSPSGRNGVAGYLDASWSPVRKSEADLDELRRGRVLAIDLNAGHLAAVVIDASGNPVGGPVTATNRGLAVIAIDPAYTSTWGAQYWLRALRQHSPVATGHHSAAVVIGRRGLGQRARRRERCDWTRPEDRQHLSRH